MRKLLSMAAMALTLVTGSFALANDCANQPAPEQVLNYTADGVPAVTGGTVTATARKGIRCYKAGDILQVMNTTTKTPVAKVKVESVKFVKFATLSPEFIKRSGSKDLAAAQDLLVKIYKEEIKTSPITEIYFSLVK